MTLTCSIEGNYCFRPTDRSRHSAVPRSRHVVSSAKKISIMCGSHPRLLQYPLLSLMSSSSKNIYPDPLDSSHGCCRMEGTDTMAPPTVLGAVVSDAESGGPRCCEWMPGMLEGGEVAPATRRRGCCKRRPAVLRQYWRKCSHSQPQSTKPFCMYFTQ